MVGGGGCVTQEVADAIELTLQQRSVRVLGGFVLAAGGEIGEEAGWPWPNS